jgi:hypothetical protein
MSSILALGFFTSSRATFPTYMVFASLAIYPAALALVYFLDYVVGQFCPPFSNHSPNHQPSIAHRTLCRCCTHISLHFGLSRHFPNLIVRFSACARLAVIFQCHVAIFLHVFSEATIKRLHISLPSIKASCLEMGNTRALFNHQFNGPQP